VKAFTCNRKINSNPPETWIWAQIVRGIEMKVQQQQH